MQEVVSSNPGRVRIYSAADNCIDHKKVYHSFGSMYFHFQLDITNNTWTEAWYLSKYCNPAIGRVDEMVKPDMSQVNN